MWGKYIVTLCRRYHYRVSPESASSEKKNCGPYSLKFQTQELNPNFSSSFGKFYKVKFYNEAHP